MGHPLPRDMANLRRPRRIGEVVMTMDRWRDLEHEERNMSFRQPGTHVPRQEKLLVDLVLQVFLGHLLEGKFHRPAVDP